MGEERRCRMYWLMQFGLALLAGMAAGVLVMLFCYYFMMQKDMKRLKKKNEDNEFTR